MRSKEDYIAVFDSGAGGISVLRQLLRLMPEENYLYFADCANAPYGTRPTQEVRALTLDAAKMLLSRGAKALVVACNTATAAAITALRQTYPEAIIIGIEPALKLAADHFPNARVGVLATPLTLREEKFAHLADRFPNMQVTAIPLPGLVEHIEAGHSDQQIETFLRPLLMPCIGQLDAAVLGCTHYPLVAQVIRKILGPQTVLLDGAAGTARQTRRLLTQADLLHSGPGSVQIETSSYDPARVQQYMHLLQSVR